MNVYSIRNFSKNEYFSSGMSTLSDKIASTTCFKIRHSSIVLAEKA